jgi:hypothetical protein
VIARLPRAIVPGAATIVATVVPAIIPAIEPRRSSAAVVEAAEALGRAVPIAIPSLVPVAAGAPVRTLTTVRRAGLIPIPHRSAIAIPVAMPSLPRIGRAIRARPAETA